MSAHTSLGFVLVLVLSAARAAAVPVVYTDPLAWAAAFDAEPVAAPFAGAPGALGTRTDLGAFDLVVQGLSFSVGGTSYPRLGAGGLLEVFIVAPDNPYAEFSAIDGGWHGFGGMWGSTLTGDRLTMIVNGVRIAFGDHLSGPGDGCLGIDDAETPITAVRFEVERLTDFGEYFTLTDLRVRPIPEPGSGLLLIVGALGLAARRRPWNEVTE